MTVWLLPTKRMLTSAVRSLSGSDRVPGDKPPRWMASTIGSPAAWPRGAVAGSEPQPLTNSRETIGGIGRHRMGTLLGRSNAFQLIDHPSLGECGMRLGRCRDSRLSRRFEWSQCIWEAVP